MQDNASPRLNAEPARFDWYSATIDDSPASVENTLEVALGCMSVPATPQHGYEHGRQLLDADRNVRATLLYGGGNGRPHAYASGDDAPAFADVVRSVWPATLAPGAAGGHYVTRVDSALDYSDAAAGKPAGDAWYRLYRASVAIAKQKNLRIGTAGDWITPDDEREHGRTLYLGSAASDVQARLYEKGLQQLELARDPDVAAGVDRTWVRLEVRVRPQRDARARAATATPLDVWGYSKWTQELLRDVERLDVERVTFEEPRETDDERAIEWMVTQYGRMLARTAGTLGGWEALGEELRRRADRLGVDTATS